MKKLMSGDTPRTWRRLLLGTGVLLEGFRPGDYADAAALRDALEAAASDDTKRLGRTVGEVCFRAEPEWAEIRRESPPWPVEGEAALTRLTARLSGTLTEVTPANLLRLLPWARSDPAGRVFLPSGGEKPRVIRDLCWAGSLSSGGLVLICLRNAVNTAGLSLTVRESGEGLLPFSFAARADRTVMGPEGAPFDIRLTEREETDE